MGFRRRWTALALATLLTTACAWKMQLRRGDEHMAAGRYDEAAQMYAEALARKPDSDEIRQRLADAKKAQIGDRETRARAAIRSGQFVDAVTLAGEAVAIDASDPRVTPLVDEVVDVAAKHAQSQSDVGQYAAAMAIFGRVETVLPAAVPKIADAAAATRQRWADQLEERAATAVAGGHLASALLYRTQRTALGHGDASEVATLRAQALAALEYRVKATAGRRDRLGQAVLETLTQQVASGPAASRLSLTAKMKNPAASLQLEIGKPRFDEDRRSRTESARYQSGTEQVPNPFHKMAQDDVLAHERRVTQAENDVTKYEGDVSRYEAAVAKEGPSPSTSTGAEQNLSSARSRLESARRKVQSERDQLLRAKEKLANTEATKEEPVYADARYEVTTHIVTGSVVVRGRIEHSDGRPPQTFEHPLQVSAEDDTHGGQAQANIASDPLNLPSRDELTDRLLRDALARLDAEVRSSFDGYRTALRTSAAQAQDPAAQVEGLLRYILLDPTQVEAGVDATVLTATGVPAASGLLATQN